MNIGKIIKSDSHLNYKCRIYGKRETPTKVTEKDFFFGQFVKISILNTIDIVGIVYNSQLINPEYGNFGPRLTSPSGYNEIIIPDFIDETAIVIDIILIGFITNNTEVSHSIPKWVLPLNSEVITMSEKEIIKFHKNKDGKLIIHYYHHLLNHTGSLGVQLVVSILDLLSQLLDEGEIKKIRVLKYHLESEFSTITSGK